MAIEKTILINIETKQTEQALKSVGDSVEKLADDVKDIGETSKKTEKEVSSLGKGLKGVGLAFKAIGIGLVLKAFEKLSTALMQNQEVADTVETVFNSIGVAFKLVTDAIVGTVNAVSKSSDNFDALGRIAKNVLDIALTPLKLAFGGIKLGIQSAMLAFEKSMFGGKDQDKIQKLTESINETKASIKEAGQQAIQSGKEIVVDFREGVDEVVNIGKVATENFKETFEDVTVGGIIEQGKAITETKKNYELLSLQQQRLIEQFDRDAEKQRQIRDDVSRSIEDRIQANTRLGEILEEQIDAEKQAIDNQIASIQERIDIEGERVELTNEIFRLETEKLAIEAKVTGFQAEQLTNINALKKEQADLDKQALDRRLLEEEALKLNLEFQKDISDEELKNLIKTENEKIKIRQQRIDTVKAMEIEAGKSILASLGTLAGEGTKMAKATALAQILINTAQSITGAIKAGAGLPFPANLGAIATGVASVLSGVASAKAIFSKVKGGGGGGVETPNNVQTAVADAGGVGPQVPNLEAIEQPTLGEDQPTVQAFVVENDISNAQALQQELDVQATL